MASPLIMEKYLRLYAESDIDALGTLQVWEPWTSVLVVPACNETSRFLDFAPPCPGRSLLILVINEGMEASIRVSAANLALAREVRAKFESQWQSQPETPAVGAGHALELFCDPHWPRDVLLVNRFSEGRQLPARGGVGHARKVGVDLAVALFHRQKVRSPWIHCSDADVQLPDTYFDCSFSKELESADYSALIYPFRHCSLDGDEIEKDVILATRLYEFSLHYYVAGLKHACSPYSFQTIGSTMAVNALSYAKVRGFPRREAGEDFYLLNKLAKVGKILEMKEGPDCEAIKIEWRRSDRVPFGTGAAVNTITALHNPTQDYRFYNPGVFELLKVWLACWPLIWRAGSSDFAPLLSQATAGKTGPGDKRQLLLQGLTALKADRALEHAFRQSGNPDQFTRQMHTWFDAFRTLKLIHFLRAHGLPSVSHEQLQRNAFFLRLLEENQGLIGYNHAIN
jgi:hypothetical protein